MKNNNSNNNNKLIISSEFTPSQENTSVIKHNSNLNIQQEKSLKTAGNHCMPTAINHRNNLYLFNLHR